MSVVQAGLAFRAARPIDDFSTLLFRIYAARVEELAQPSLEGFDPRRPGDVMLQTFHDVCFISNLDLGLRAIGGDTAETTRLHEALGAPAIVLAYCHDEARGRHGYALVSRGRLVRRRMQTVRAPEAQAGAGSGLPAAGPTHVVEQGAPQPFERRWLSASHFIEDPESHDAPPRRMYYLGDREILVPEHELTARLLHEALETLLGVCPWDTLITPRYRFFRIAGAAGDPHAGGARAPGSPRPPSWWRRLWR